MIDESTNINENNLVISKFGVLTVEQLVEFRARIVGVDDNNNFTISTIYALKEQTVKQ
ncbi:MAG: hypothetical protein WC358_06985 [Ignavibacteria bacterium]